MTAMTVWFGKKKPVEMQKLLSVSSFHREKSSLVFLSFSSSAV